MNNRRKKETKEYTRIPKEFQLAGITHKVLIYPQVTIGEEVVYGCFLPSKQEIHLSDAMMDHDGALCNLSEELIFNTFMHELAHAYQFYLGSDFSELFAQTLGNLLSEYQRTAK